MKGPRESEGMSMIVRTVCGWLKGFILLYGIHVILYGHLTPGGGFAGGVIAAAAFVLIMLAEGERAALKTFSRQSASNLGSLGVLLFWLMSVLGIVVTGIFFANFWTGMIETCEIGIGLMVFSLLYLILTVLNAMPLISRPEDK